MPNSQRQIAQEPPEREVERGRAVVIAGDAVVYSRYFVFVLYSEPAISLLRTGRIVSYPGRLVWRTIDVRHFGSRARVEQQER
jgi:hypothetical protein